MNTRTIVALVIVAAVLVPIYFILQAVVPHLAHQEHRENEDYNTRLQHRPTRTAHDEAAAEEAKRRMNADAERRRSLASAHITLAVAEMRAAEEALAGPSVPAAIEPVAEAEAHRAASEALRVAAAETEKARADWMAANDRTLSETARLASLCIQYREAETEEVRAVIAVELLPEEGAAVVMHPLRAAFGPWHAADSRHRAAALASEASSVTMAEAEAAVVGADADQDAVRKDVLATSKEYTRLKAEQGVLEEALEAHQMIVPKRPPSTASAEEWNRYYAALSAWRSKDSTMRSDLAKLDGLVTKARSAYNKQKERESPARRAVDAARKNRDQRRREQIAAEAALKKAADELAPVQAAYQAELATGEIILKAERAARSNAFDAAAAAVEELRLAEAAARKAVDETAAALTLAREREAGAAERAREERVRLEERIRGLASALAGIDPLSSVGLMSVAGICRQVANEYRNHDKVSVSLMRAHDQLSAAAQVK